MPAPQTNRITSKNGGRKRVREAKQEGGSARSLISTVDVGNNRQPRAESTRWTEAAPVPKVTNPVSSTTTVSVCPAAELPPGSKRIVAVEGQKIGVFNCAGTLYAIEDRCSHDDGPLAEGEFDPAACTVECPRHGSIFDLKTGRPRTLPAFSPVRTFPIKIVDETITLEVD